MNKANKESERNLELLNCIPTNWCDPLLTGKNKVIFDTNGYYRVKDIEALLTGIRDRMVNIIAKVGNE